MDEVELVFTTDSLDAIAAQAIKRGTGARGLRAILEEVLLNTMYDLPSRTDVERVVIDRDVVAEKVNPTLVPARDRGRSSREIGLITRPLLWTSALREVRLTCH